MIRAHVRPDGDNAHVVIYTSLDDTAPCGVLTMPAADGAELAARVNDHDVTPVVTPEIAAHVLHHYGHGGTAPDDPSTGPLIAALHAAQAHASRARRRRLTAAEPAYALAVQLATEGPRGIAVLESRVAGTAPVAVSVGGA